jgi:hypothetical protein
MACLENLMQGASVKGILPDSLVKAVDVKMSDALEATRTGNWFLLCWRS